MDTAPLRGYCTKLSLLAADFSGETHTRHARRRAVGGGFVDLGVYRATTAAGAQLASHQAAALRLHWEG